MDYLCRYAKYTKWGYWCPYKAESNATPDPFERYTSPFKPYMRCPRDIKRSEDGTPICYTIQILEGYNDKRY